MADEKRKKILELPMKIIFNEEGINFFLKSNKKLSKFKLADEAEHYGIFFDTFSPASVQKMMLINYISYMEISRPEFMSKRQDVMDLSKLVTYGSLYRRFDEIVFSKVLDSEVIRKWNRSNQSSIIDRKTTINDVFLAQSLEKNKTTVAGIRQEILRNFVAKVSGDSALQPEEKNLQLFLAEKYLATLRPFTWFILVKFRDQAELVQLLSDIEVILKDFMVKSKIAEYLSLMTMELAIMAENSHIQSFAKNRYKGTLDPVAVMYDPEMRKMIVEEMRVRSQNIFLSWKVGGESSKGLNSRERLQVRIFNKEGGSGFEDFKKSIDDSKSQNVKQKSLMDFYKEGADDAAANTDLGLYYLSYLFEECQKVGVHFESLVNQTRENNLTVITLNLLF
jgi:hypothetical protein